MRVDALNNDRSLMQQIDSALESARSPKISAQYNSQQLLQIKERQELVEYALKINNQQRQRDSKLFGSFVKAPNQQAVMDQINQSYLDKQQKNK